MKWLKTFSVKVILTVELVVSLVGVFRISSLLIVGLLNNTIMNAFKQFSIIGFTCVLVGVALV